MAEYSSNALQTVNAGQNVIFTASPVPCDMGFIVWRPDSGLITLRGIVPYQYSCSCNKDRFAQYYASFSANIAIPTGETVGEISLSLAINGEPIPTSAMLLTPAAVEEFGNVSTQIYIPVPNGCCQTLAVENTSSIPILIQNANLTLTRPDMYARR